MPAPQARSHSTALAIASLLALAVIAGLDYAYLTLRFGGEGQVGSEWWAMSDFRDAIYFPCRAVFAGINPYDIASYREHFGDKIGLNFPLYSPLIFLLYGLLALLPYYAAGWLFQFSNLLLLLCCCGLVLRWCGWKVTLTSVCTLAGLAFLSEPGRTNLTAGQVAWPLVLATYLALVCARTRPGWSGVALAIMSFKPTYLVGIGFLMLCRGNFKALGYGIVWTIVATSAGLGWMAANGIQVWQMPEVALANHAATVAAEAAQPYLTSSRVDVTAFLGKVFNLPANAWPMHLAPTVVMLVTGWLVWRESQCAASFEPDSFATFLICLGSLFGIYHHVYDLLLLILPAVALFKCAHPSWQRLPAWGLTALRIGIVILICNVFWTGPAVHIAGDLTAHWPSALQPWAAMCWHGALVLNSLVVAVLWATAAAMGALLPRSLPAPALARMEGLHSLPQRAAR